jgi:radical SAM protein (TIGR04043 family)
MHLEAVGEEVRAVMLPGKAEVHVERYFEAFEAAVRVFGRGQVSTYLIAGLGDPPEALVAASARLAALGVYPFIVPLVPIRGTRLADRAPPAPEVMRAIYEQVGPLLASAGLRAEDALAGCTRCGACSSLPQFEALREGPGREASLYDVGNHVPARPGAGGAPRVLPLAPGHLLRRAGAVRGHG